MYSYRPPHMAEKKQDDRLEHIYSSSVRIRDVALGTCQKRWMIGKSGERESGISMLAARQDDDDDDDDDVWDHTWEVFAPSSYYVWSQMPGWNLRIRMLPCEFFHELLLWFVGFLDSVMLWITFSENNFDSLLEFSQFLVQFGWVAVHYKP